MLTGRCASSRLSTNGKEGKPDQLLSEALAQIHEKKYYERYNGENKRIALLAVAFAGREIAGKMLEIATPLT